MTVEVCEKGKTALRLSSFLFQTTYEHSTHETDGKWRTSPRSGRASEKVGLFFFQIFFGFAPQKIITKKIRKKNKHF